MRGCALAVALAVMGPGCIHHYGPPIADQGIAQLRPGETTIENAFALFGPPQSTSESRDGQTTQTIMVWLNWNDGEYRSLVLTFGEDRRLVRYQTIGSSTPKPG